MAVLPDGKIVVAGSWRGRAPVTRGAMVRLDPDGSLDRGFGADGGLVDFRGPSPLGPISVGADGTIVASTGEALGGTLPTNEGFLLRRYLADGSPSPGFGRGGIAEGPIVEPGQSAFAAAVVTLPGGCLAVAGRAAGTVVKAAAASGAIAQLFDADGSFVETVGRLEEPMQPEVRETGLTDLLPRPDGSLVGVGWSNRLTPDPVLLARFLPGSKSAFDPTFAAGAGILLFQPFPESPRPSSANAIVASGKRLITAGSGLSGFLLAGFDEAGVLDKSFGDEGLARPPMPGFSYAEATAAAVQPDGKIVAAGRALGVCPDNPLSECWTLLVARFHADGSIDGSFGANGFTQVAYAPATGGEPSRIDVAIAPAGKVLVSEVTGGSGTPTFTVARLNSNGSVDASFRGGVVTVAPCQGRVADLRRTGCFSTARVSLRARGLRGPSPRLRLTVRASDPLDPLRNVRLSLPGALQGRRGLSGRARAFGEGGKRVKATVRPRRIAVNRLGWSRSVSLVVPRGVLRQAERASGGTGRKLAFRVRVWFEDGSSQAFVLRRTE
jgi:uncharacterized delta-60 repeat protein